MVTGLFCLVRKKHLEESDGYKGGSFQGLFDFADISLEFRGRGLKNIYSSVSVAQYSSCGFKVWSGLDKKSIRDVRHRALFQKKWQQVLESGDPFYNEGCYLEKDISIQDFKRWYHGS